MPTEQDFVPFATGVGANVQDQADYAAATSTGQGFQPGILPSANLNKPLRQATFMSAVLAQAVSNILSEAMIDDGDFAGKVTLVQDALTAAANTSVETLALQKANNLSDLVSLVAAWSNLDVAITTTSNGFWAQIGPLLVQWGNIATSNGTFSFPKAFSSTTGLIVVPGNSDTMGADNDTAYITHSSITTTTFFAATRSASGSGTTGYGVSWIAIGPA